MSVENTRRNNQERDLRMIFTAKRVIRNYTQTINATPVHIFPLLCPVREADWLEGWQYTMLYSESGVAEEGAVFSTPYPGEPDTIWIVTKHDFALFEVEFARVTPGSHATFIKLKIRARDNRCSNVDISYSHIGLTPEGNAFIDNYTEDVFLKMVQDWERSMNHFLLTGSKLSLL